MNIITLTKENLAKEHICCAIANEKDCQVASKKAWLAARMDDGLVFKKGDVRGKCFIEYIPAEKAWAPVEAPGWMYIDCLWVSGQFKGHGNSNLLLDACVADSREKGKAGLVILSSDKKRPFLADPKYLAHKGFLEADAARPFYRLMYLPFDERAEKPRFRPAAKGAAIAEQGLTLCFSRQCPYPAKYVPLLAETARARNVPFQIVEFLSAEQAQAGPAPFSAFSLYYRGEFVTNETLSVAKFETMLNGWGL